MDIHSKYNKKVTVQEYGSKAPAISGVEFMKSPFHKDDGGNFTEIFRLTNGLVEELVDSFEVRQLSMSVVVPGTIKAYHLHYEQDDLWFVSPYDRLLVNLHDVRQDSPTFDTHMRLVLGAGSAVQVRIPKGVAHGVSNPYHRDMTLFYATSQQFNAKEPDEQRLPWDVFGADVWELTRG